MIELIRMIRPYILGFLFASASYEVWLWYDVPFYDALLALMIVYSFGWMAGVGFQQRRK